MMTIFSERLVILRKQVGKTQNDVSKELKIALRAYQNYEYGTAEPRLSTLVKLADFYGVSLDYLAGRRDTPYGWPHVAACRFSAEECPPTVP